MTSERCGRSEPGVKRVGSRRFSLPAVARRMGSQTIGRLALRATRVVTMEESWSKETVRPILHAAIGYRLKRVSIWRMVKSGLSALTAVKVSSVWMVLAVMAARPKTPCASMVLMSASTPAPPQGSKPPMVRT